MTGGPPNAAGSPPPDLDAFERLQSELEAAVANLNDEELPLEDRLALHTRAVGLHARLERMLEAAREAAGAVEREAEAAPPEEVPPAAADSGPEEPYEVLHARLRETVERLDRGELPLAEVVRLHGEAHRLAAGCDRILKTARGRVERLAAGRAEPSPTADSGKPASRAGSGASSRRSAPADELDDEDAPF